MQTEISVITPVHCIIAIYNRIRRIVDIEANGITLLKRLNFFLGVVCNSQVVTVGEAYDLTKSIVINACSKERFGGQCGWIIVAHTKHLIGCIHNDLSGQNIPEVCLGNTSIQLGHIGDPCLFLVTQSVVGFFCRTDSFHMAEEHRILLRQFSDQAIDLFNLVYRLLIAHHAGHVPSVLRSACGVNDHEEAVCINSIHRDDPPAVACYRNRLTIAPAVIVHHKCDSIGSRVVYRKGNRSIISIYFRCLQLIRAILIGNAIVKCQYIAPAGNRVDMLGRFFLSQSVVAHFIAHIDNITHAVSAFNDAVPISNDCIVQRLQGSVAFQRLCRRLLGFGEGGDLGIHGLHQVQDLNAVQITADSRRRSGEHLLHLGNSRRILCRLSQLGDLRLASRQLILGSLGNQCLCFLGQSIKSSSCSRHSILALNRQDAGIRQIIDHSLYLVRLFLQKLLGSHGVHTGNLPCAYLTGVSTRQHGKECAVHSIRLLVNENTIPTGRQRCCAYTLPVIRIHPQSLIALKRIVDIEEQVIIWCKCTLHTEAGDIRVVCGRRDIHSEHLTIVRIIHCVNGAFKLCIRCLEHFVQQRIEDHSIAIHCSNTGIQLDLGGGAYKVLLYAQSVICLLCLVDSGKVLHCYSARLRQSIDQRFHSGGSAVVLQVGDAVEVRHLPLGALHCRQCKVELDDVTTRHKLTVIRTAKIRQSDTAPGIGLQGVVGCVTSAGYDIASHIIACGIVNIEYHIMAGLELGRLHFISHRKVTCGFKCKHLTEVCILNDLVACLCSGQALVGDHIIDNIKTVQVIAVVGGHAVDAGNHPAFACKGGVSIVRILRIEVNGFAGGNVVIHKGGCSIGMRLTSVKQLHPVPLLGIQGHTVLMDPAVITKGHTKVCRFFCGVVDIQHRRAAVLVSLCDLIFRNRKVSGIRKGHDAFIGCVIDICVKRNTLCQTVHRIGNDDQLAFRFQRQIFDLVFTSNQLGGVHQALQVHIQCLICAPGLGHLVLVCQGRIRGLRQCVDQSLHIRNQLGIIPDAVEAGHLPLAGHRACKGQRIVCHLIGRNCNQCPGLSRQGHFHRAIGRIHITAGGIVHIELHFTVLGRNCVQGIFNASGIGQVPNPHRAIIGIQFTILSFVHNTVGSCTGYQGIQLVLQVCRNIHLADLIQIVECFLRIQHAGIILRHFRIVRDTVQGVDHSLNSGHIHILSTHCAIDQHQCGIAGKEGQGIATVFGVDDLGLTANGHAQRTVILEMQGNILRVFVVIVDHIESVLSVVIEATGHCTFCSGTRQVVQLPITIKRACGVRSGGAALSNHQAQIFSIHQNLIHSQNLRVDVLDVIVVRGGVTVSANNAVTVIVEGTQGGSPEILLQSVMIGLHQRIVGDALGAVCQRGMDIPAGHSLCHISIILGVPDNIAGHVVAGLHNAPEGNTVFLCHFLDDLQVGKVFFCITLRILVREYVVVKGQLLDILVIGKILFQIRSVIIFRTHLAPVRKQIGITRQVGILVCHLRQSLMMLPISVRRNGVRVSRLIIIRHRFIRKSEAHERGIGAQIPDVLLKILRIARHVCCIAGLNEHTDAVLLRQCQLFLNHRLHGSGADFIGGGNDQIDAGFLYQVKNRIGPVIHQRICWAVFGGISQVAGSQEAADGHNTVSTVVVLDGVIALGEGFFRRLGAQQHVPNQLHTGLVGISLNGHLTGFADLHSLIMLHHGHQVASVKAAVRMGIALPEQHHVLRHGGRHIIPVRKALYDLILAGYCQSGAACLALSVDGNAACAGEIIVTVGQVIVIGFPFIGRRQIRFRRLGFQGKAREAYQHDLCNRCDRTQPCDPFFCLHSFLLVGTASTKSVIFPNSIHNYDCQFTNGFSLRRSRQSCRNHPVRWLLWRVP